MLALIFSTGGKVYFTGGKGTFCTKTKKFEEVYKSRTLMYNFHTKRDVLYKIV